MNQITNNTGFRLYAYYCILFIGVCVSWGILMRSGLVCKDGFYPVFHRYILV
jgi:hypothetical protein